MPWGAAIAAAGAFGSAALSGSNARDAARSAGRAAQRRPAELNMGFGLTRTGADGIIQQDNNQFTDLSRLFADIAGQQAGAAGTPLFDLGATGFSPQMLGQNNMGIQNQFGALGAAINSQPQFDPNAFAATQFDRLESLASRGDELAANRVANQLFSQGRLGARDTRTGAAFEGLARAQGDSRTQRALTATQLANSEAQRMFNQNQTGIQNQFGMLGSLFQQQQQGLQGFQGLQTLLQGTQQQGLQNALGFGQGAGAVLNPNFQQLQAVLNAQATDQSTRAGVASTQGQILAAGGQATADAVGNVFGGIGQAIYNNRSG